MCKMKVTMHSLVKVDDWKVGQRFALALGFFLYSLKKQCTLCTLSMCSAHYVGGGDMEFI